MSDWTYTYCVNQDPSPSKPLRWIHGEVKTPPFTKDARLEAGFLLRRLQDGESLGMPHSRPMPSVGARCHEGRLVDAGSSWRIVYRIDIDAVLILEVFRKTTRQTPQKVIDTCKARIRNYDSA